MNAALSGKGAVVTGATNSQDYAIVKLKSDGTLGVKDPLKMYTVSTYSDVANLQARGKRNPNNQAKGFINGLGDMPNPGFDKPGGFYPEAKTFSLSTVTGFRSVVFAAPPCTKSCPWLGARNPVRQLPNSAAARGSSSRSRPSPGTRAARSRRFSTNRRAT